VLRGHRDAGPRPVHLAAGLTSCRLRPCLRGRLPASAAASPRLPRLSANWRGGRGLPRCRPVNATALHAVVVSCSRWPLASFDLCPYSCAAMAQTATPASALLQSSGSV
jgi:hypothetical protein